MSLEPVTSNVLQNTPVSHDFGMSAQYCYISVMGVLTGFCVQRSRLWHILHSLEGQTGFVVPESDAPIVAAREKNAIIVQGKRVDDAVLPLEVVHDCIGKVSFLLNYIKS